MKKALIVGVYGQDGYFLSKLLLSKNYKVFGLVRKIKIYNDLSKKIKIFKCRYKNPNTVNIFFKKNELDERIVKNGKIKLGNLNIERDWGSAEEYVYAMWLILQQKEPDDYVVGTGISKSLREICDIAFSIKGLDWKKHVISSSKLFRIYDIKKNRANIDKIKKKLSWIPKIKVKDLLSSMINNQIKSLKKSKDYN